MCSPRFPSCRYAWGMTQRFRLAALGIAALLASCTSTGGYRAQGIFGAMDVTRLAVDVEPVLGDSTHAEHSSFPMVGGAWMVPFGETSSGIEWGLETGFTWGAKWDSADLVIDGSIVADNDYTLVDVFGGAFASLPLGRSVRASVAAGPLVQWGRIELTFESGGPEDIDEEGAGFGLYTRAGLDFNLGRGTWVGIGARFSDASILFDDVVEEVDIGGTLLYVTLTYSR